MSDITKENKKKYIFFCIMSAIVTFGPMLFYVIKGFIEGSTVSKFTMGAACTVAICLFALNAVFKQHLRCPLWILLAGVYAALDSLETLIIILAVTTALDDFLFTPAVKHYKNKYTINKEIDGRLNN